MFTGMELTMCQNLAVPAEVMRHVVHVESASNPYAIGVVGGQLVRQPRNLGEALATVHMLDARGYNYSLGAAQVNRGNLGRYGLDSYEKAFQLCPNLIAASNILADCYRSAGGNWGNAFSCYYSGNFVTGYKDGYVQKIYDSIHRSGLTNATANGSEPIPLSGQPLAYGSSPRGVPWKASTDASYRQAIRSVALDSIAAAAIPAVASAVSNSDATPSVAPQKTTADTSISPATAARTFETTSPAVAASADPAQDAIFVPQVRGPGDVSAAPGTAAPQPQAIAASGSSTPAVDSADLRRESIDAAFVF